MRTATTNGVTIYCLLGNCIIVYFVSHWRHSQNNNSLGWYSHLVQTVSHLGHTIPTQSTKNTCQQPARVEALHAEQNTGAKRRWERDQREDAKPEQTIQNSCTSSVEKGGTPREAASQRHSVVCQSEEVWSVPGPFADMIHAANLRLLSYLKTDNDEDVNGYLHL